MTVRLPEEKHHRLKELATRRHTTLNRLIDEMATMLLADNDAETRFLLRAQSGKGKRERGLKLLEKAQNI